MARCLEHNIDPDSEEWRVAFEEIIEEDGKYRAPFEGQVCPLCYVRLIDKYRRARREAKIQSRKAISSGQEALRHANIVRAVTEAVKALGGPDAFDIAGQKFPVSPCNRGGTPQGMIPEPGKLENILPNIITELVHKAKQEALQVGKLKVGDE